MSQSKGLKTLQMTIIEENMEVTEIIEDLSPLKNSSKENKKLTRGEKSKLAAKRRRDNETGEIEKLIELLPFSSDSLKKLDKNSLMDLLLDYMKMKHHIHKEMAALSLKDADDNQENKNQVTVPSMTNNTVALINGMEIEESTLMLEAMNGFLVLLDKKKRTMYVSDGVMTHLGIDQIYMLGKHIKDFVHPDDMMELRKQFNLKACTDTNSCNCTPIVNGHNRTDTPHEPPHLDNARVFYLRMKFYLKRKSSRRKYGGYKLVQWSGRLKMRSSNQPGGYAVDGMICICRPMQTNAVLEIQLDGNMFMSRHDLGMRFTFCDPRIITLIGYEPQELIGKTAYTFHNPIDAPTVSNCHSNLIVKGASVSKYYRFIGKNCDWVWMQTRATIIYNTNNVPQYIVCMNYIISEEEGQRYLMMENEGVVRGRGSAVECGPIEDHHSDSGYGSSTSPYSSMHHSPCSDIGNNINDNHKGNFPTNVFQEVANTVNGTLGNDESVVQFLKDYNKPGQNVTQNKCSRIANTPHHSSAQSKRPVSRTSSLQKNALSNQRKSGTANFNLSSGTFPSNLSMKRNASTGDIQHIPQKISPGGLSSARVSSVQHLSVQGSNMAELDTLYLPDQSNCPVLSPDINSMSPHTISDDSNEPINFMSQDVLADAIISDVNLVSQDCQSPESIPQQSVPSSGLMNVQVGLLNTMDLDSINGDLPKEITDFCIEYCESMMESQAQQLMSTFGQGELMKLNQLTYPGTTTNNQQMNQSNDSQINNTGSSNLAFCDPVLTTASDVTPMNSVLNPTSTQTFSFPCHTSTGTNSVQSPMESFPAPFPLQPGQSLAVPSATLPTMQSQNTVQMASQNSWPERFPVSSRQSILKNLMSPPAGLVPQSMPRSPYHSSQCSPQSGSILSPIPSPFSPPHTPISPSATVANSYHTTCIPNNTNGLTSPCIQYRSQNSNKNISCNNCNSAQNRTMSSQVGIDQCGSRQNSPAAHVSACNSIMNSQKTADYCSGATSDKQNMSELEKMLRGYSNMTGVLESTHPVCGEQGNSSLGMDLNGSGTPPILQQMLTGQLSSEKYRAMEKRRKMDSPVSKAMH